MPEPHRRTFISNYIKDRHLVSLNTARIKLKKQHPRISNDLEELFELLKEIKHYDKTSVYKEDGYINIDN